MDTWLCLVIGRVTMRKDTKLGLTYTSEGQNACLRVRIRVHEAGGIGQSAYAMCLHALHRSTNPM